jgi:hypothetical protein
MEKKCAARETTAPEQHKKREHPAARDLLSQRFH